MAFCMNCGAQIPDGAGFCNNCGTAQGADGQAAAADAATERDAVSAATDAAAVSGSATDAAGAAAGREEEPQGPHHRSCLRRHGTCRGNRGADPLPDRRDRRQRQRRRCIRYREGRYHHLWQL
ncbi:MAG: zinc ribbon domain-containing protein [Lachnospiraceae bacterium]|nr:zinc ribbon domain-containing protein [Lachnospiraceae bacterium]